MAFGSTPLDGSGTPIPLSCEYVPGVGLVVLQGSSITNTDGSSNVSAPATFHRAPGTVLNQASAAKTATGNSADLAVGPYTELTVDINITAVSGTTPTIQVFIDRKGVDGIYYAIWQSVSQTAVSVMSTSIGAGCAITQSLGTTVQLRWVITGTTPSFTFSASLIGK